MREAQRVFVDSGAWIALALRRDPLHDSARAVWEAVQGSGARLFTSIPVVLETFTFLDRNADRDVAIAWKDALKSVRRLKVLACTLADVDASWQYFRGPDLHRLSAVDATSFVIMTRSGIRAAFSFDHHFAAAGFRLVA